MKPERIVVLEPFYKNTGKTRSGHNYFAIGKLKEGISLDIARQDMRAIGDPLQQQYKENRFKTVAVTTLAEKLTASAETTLWVLSSAVLGVLLFACANVANLQLARAASGPARWRYRLSGS